MPIDKAVILSAGKGSRLLRSPPPPQMPDRAFVEKAKALTARWAAAK
jgi:hypothetical protein